MLDYGINFNVEEGKKKALKEIEEAGKEFQKLLDKNKLKVNFKPEDFNMDEVLKKVGTKASTLKIPDSIAESIKNLRAEFRQLTVEETKAGRGQELLDKYRNLKNEAGIYAGTLDQAVKAQDKMTAAAGKSISAIDSQTKAYKRQSDILVQLKSYAMNFLSVYGGIRLTKNMVDITGEFEAQRISLQAILRDAQKGEAKFEKIKTLAVISPYTFKDLVGYTKQLSAFSVPYNELYETTKMLADVSAGLGVEMYRIILAYGQVRSAAVLRGCLGVDTEISMYDGSVKKVQDVIVGDLLAGDNNNPRIVKELIRGRELMYSVIGDDYTYRVNKNHILTLFDVTENKVVDLYVDEYLESPQKYKGARYENGEYLTYEIIINKDNIDDYFGFVIDDNKRFLIGNNVVTHNTELRQFTEAGIPLVQMLADKFTALKGEVVSAADVFDLISTRQVPFEMIKDIFVEMTSEGGKFYNMQEKLADTLKGKVANLTDAFQIMMAEIGEKGSGVLKGAIDSTRWLMENYDAIGKILLGLVATYGTYRAAVIAASVAENIRYQSTLAQMAGMTRMGAIMEILTAKTKALNAVIMKNPYAIAAAALIAVVSALILFRDRATAAEKAQEALNKRFKEQEEYAEKERSEVTRLINVVKDEISTRTEKQLALEKLQRMYPDIFGNMDVEALKIANTTKLLSEQNEQLEKRNNLSNAGRLPEIDAELERLRKEHGTTAYAGQYQYTIDHAKRIATLEKEREGITGKIAENERAATQAAFDALSPKEKITNLEKANAKLLDMQRNAKNQEEYDFIEKQILQNERLARSIEVGGKTAQQEIDGWLTSLKELDAEQKKINADASLSTEKRSDILKGIEERRKELEELLKSRGWVEPKKDKDTSKKDAEKAVKDYLDNIQKQVDEYGKKLNIWKIIYERTGEKPKIDFGVEFDGEPNLEEYIKRKMQEIGKGKLNLDLDFLTADFKDIIGENIFDEQTEGSLKKYFDELRNIKLEQFNTNQDMISKYQDYAEKRLSIEKNLTEEIKKLEKLRSSIGDDAVDRKIKKASNDAAEEVKALQKEILNKYGLDEFLSDGDVSDFVKKKIRAALPLFKSLTTATLSELNKISNVIDGIELPPELIADFKEAGGDLEALNKMLESVVKNANEAVDERKIAKIVAEINKVASSVRKLASALEQSGNKLLSSLGSFVGKLSDGVDNVLSLYEKGEKATNYDKISTGISGIATIIETVNSVIEDNKRAQEEWNNAIADSVQKMRLLNIEQMAYKEGSIFGMDNPLAPAIAGIKQYTAAMDELSGITKELEEGYVQIGTKKVPKGSAYAGFIAGGAGIGATVGSVIPVIGTALGGVIGGLLGGLAAGISSLFGGSSKTVPVLQKLKDKYKEIYDKDFNLNPQIIADYKKLDESTKKIVDNWEEIKEKAKEAQEQIEDTLKNITGSIGEDLYSALIEAFDNNDLDSAMDKFRNRVNQILSEFSTKVLFNAYFQDLFETAEQRMKDSIGDEGDQNIMDDIDWLAREMEKRIPGFNNAMDYVSKQMEDLGRELDFGNKSTNLTGVSKNIAQMSEDTGLVLGGTLTSMRNKMFEYYDYMMNNTTPFMSQMLLHGAEAVIRLQEIAVNTRETADNTKIIADTAKKTDERISSIIAPADDNRGGYAAKVNT